MMKVLFFQVMVIIFAISCTEAGGINTAETAAKDYKSNELELYLDSLIDDTAILIADSAEISSLLFMREEEKLARDVYITLYEKWGIRAFNNISTSEQRHMDAVLTLLDYFNIEDVVGENPVGSFKNEELQALYDTLIVQGNTSEIEALKVGALIEEVDIIDLLEDLEQTRQEAIRIVYGNLIKGSENHLRAFVRNLKRRGVNYEPQLLSDDSYSDIINAY